MDFNFGEEQQAIRELAREILVKEVTPELHKQLESGPEWFARSLWKNLGEANLLGVAVPEALGGSGLGLLEVCVLLEEVGRTAAPVPVLASLVLGGAAIGRAGNDAQRERWLGPLARGETILSGALVDADSADPMAPATTATRDGDGWRLDGRKRFVPAAGLADVIVVPARVEGGIRLFAVDPRGEGVTLSPNVVSTHEPLFDVALTGARVGRDALLGDDAGGAEHLRWWHDCALVAVAAVQLGVSARALEITTDYAKQREQFGAPIGSFPPVQHRAADCYIDLEALRWTTWRAAYRLAEDLPASRDAAVAKIWAADAGSRIANAAQHLHGGMGVDRDYPIHRYFLWSKSLELALGGATPQLARLGRDMARTGPQEFA